MKRTFKKENFIQGFYSFIEQKSCDNSVVRSTYLDILNRYSEQKNELEFKDLEDLSAVCVKYLKANCWKTVSQNRMRSFFIGEIPKFFPQEEKVVVSEIISNYQNSIINNEIDLIIDQGKMFINQVNMNKF